MSTNMSHSIQGTYVSEKIKKIRWRPDPFNNVHYFISGSYDNGVNNFKLWDFHGNEDCSDVYPFVITNHAVKGDITEVKFINADFFVASFSSGMAKLLKLSTDYKGAINIVEEVVWNNLHYYHNEDTCSCTSFACYDTDVVTVGEDGRINFLSVQSKEVVRTINEADSCSLNCVTFLKHDEILTGNLRGLMKIWDLRCKFEQPSSSFLLNEDLVMPTCLAYHPTQQHIIVAGDEEGSVTVWDLRQNTFPVNLLNAHSESISELQFHPDYPDQLFSCSNSGELWHWAPEQKPSVCNFLRESSEEINPWLMTDNVKNKMEVFSLMPDKLHKPINTLDLNRNKILCGCDNEAIYLIKGINLLR